MKASIQLTDKLKEEPKLESEYLFLADYSKRNLQKLKTISEVILDGIEMEADFINLSSVQIHESKFQNEGLSHEDVLSNLIKLSDDIKMYGIPNYKYRKSYYTVDFDGLNDTHIKNLKTINRVISGILNDKHPQNAQNEMLVISQKTISLGNKTYMPHKGSIEESILSNLVGNNKSRKREGKYNYPIDINWLKNTIADTNNLTDERIKKAFHSMNRSLRNRGITTLTFKTRKDKIHIIES